MAGALIGALRVSLSAETSAFEAGMKRSQRQAKATANSIVSDFKGMGGLFNSLKAGVAGFVASLSVGTILAAGKAALDYAGSLGETAQQLGVTTRELQTFRYAAGQMGVTQEEADKGLQKLTLSMSKATAGSKPTIAAFNAVGVSLDDIKNKGAVEIFGQMSDAMKATGGASKSAAEGAAIMGRSFQKFVPLADAGSEGLNQLARAAQELGVVLSDEQISKADETADRLDALQTVLKAQIAGVVSDNADSILELANAIAQVASQAGAAIGKVRAFYEEARIAYNETQNFLSKEVDSGILGFLGIGNKTRAANRAANDKDTARIRQGQGQRRYQEFNQANPFPFNKQRGSDGARPQFLAGGGGGGRKRSGGRDRSAEEAERKRLEALRDANQFDQEIRRANIDILNAKRALATDEIERYQISVDIKDAERAAFASQLQYEVAAGERTGVQAEQLQLEYDKKDQLERDLMIAEESERARQASADVNANVLQMERDLLESQAQLAETASERRTVQLKLLDNAYALQRLQLEEIIASRAATDAQKLIAQQRLDQLKNTYSNDRQAVMNDTRGPLEDYMSELPTTTEKWNESLEMVAANGLKAVEDGIVDILTGAKSVGDALQDILAGIIEQLIRIGVQKMIGMAIGGGFAEGGYTGTGGKYEPAGVVHRGEYVFDSTSTKQLGVPFLEALRQGKMPGMAMGGLAGLPVPRVSYGERVSVSNDNGRQRGGDTFQFSFPGVSNAREARTAGIQAAGAFKQQIARAVRTYD